MNCIEVKTEAQIVICREALFAFRPGLQEATYINLILDMIADERFKLVYIPNEDDTKAAAFVGYRTMHMLRTGWIIYIDDLYTGPAYRGKGYAGALLDYVDAEAAKNGITGVHLDSGCTLHDAHRLYLNKRFLLGSIHFAKKLV
jgi:GNAT superfamily N-acetyltransferase